jgi:hypothetical protein
MFLRMRTAVLLTTWVAGACYNYTPLATLEPRPGTSLAVTLSDAGSDSLARYLGPDVFMVRGRYLSTDAAEGALRVSVVSVETRLGLQNSWAGETVKIPRAFIMSLEQRQLAKGKSALLAGAGVAGVVAAAAAFSLKPGGAGNIFAPQGPSTAK